MIEYILIAVAVACILGTMIYYSGKSSPPKSCSNCRFYDADTEICEISIYKKVCDQWDWNGERDEQ